MFPCNLHCAYLCTTWFPSLHSVPSRPSLLWLSLLSLHTIFFMISLSSSHSWYSLYFSHVSHSQLSFLHKFGQKSNNNLNPSAAKGGSPKSHFRIICDWEPNRSTHLFFRFESLPLRNFFNCFAIKLLFIWFGFSFASIRYLFSYFMSDFSV